MERSYFKCSDGHSMAYNTWIPQDGTEIKAYLQIFHGMAEHSARYDAFARYLNGFGIAVFADDHRGHGYSAEDGLMGWFCEEEGWNRIAQDEYELAIFMKQSVIPEGTPLVLMGHSMGSFLARTVASQHPEVYDALIIMGTGCSKGALGKIGQMLCNMQIKKHGSKAPSPFMDKMSFSAYNSKIRNPRTQFDWLSKDEKEVDKYIADPMCGFLCTNGFFKDLLYGVEYANSPANAARIPKTMPVLVISGDSDPVGDWGKGVAKVFKLYKDAGVKDLRLHLVPQGRHEILNETDRQDTYKVLSDWMTEHI